MNKVKVQTYPAYKDSGVEWLGEIPEGWEVFRLASLGRFSASGIDKLTKRGESSVKIINYTDVYRNLSCTISENMKLMVVTTPETNRISNLVNKGDLIFLPSSETFEDLGLSALVDNHLENTSFSYHVLRFKFFKKLDHNFKKYFTNNSKVLTQFSIKGTGSIRKTLGRNDFRNTLVILPPLPEQTAIAKFLDDKTAKIDQAIAQKEQLIALLKERKQIIIQQAVTKGLDPNVKMKDSGVEWIGEVPEHWEVKKIKFSSQVLRGKFTHRPRNDQRFYGGEFPFIQTGDISGTGKYIISYSQTLNYRGFKVSKQFPKGTIVLTITGSNTGEVAILNFDACFPDSIVGFFPSQGTDSQYLYEGLYSLRNVLIQSSTKNTQMNLNIERVSSRRLPSPPYQEQMKIVQFIASQQEMISKSISLQQTQIQKLKEYKATLIDSAVTGKIKVC